MSNLEIRCLGSSDNFKKRVYARFLLIQYFGFGGSYSILFFFVPYSYLSVISYEAPAELFLSCMKFIAARPGLSLPPHYTVFISSLISYLSSSLSLLNELLRLVCSCFELT